MLVPWWILYADQYQLRRRRSPSLGARPLPLIHMLELNPMIVSRSDWLRSKSHYGGPARID